MRLHRIYTLSLFFMFFILQACGDFQNPPINNNTPLSPRMVKLAQLAGGSMTANVQAFDSSGRFYDQDELAIDLVKGQAYSTPNDRMKLKLGNSYTFLIQFFYETPSITKLPIGFVLKSHTMYERYEHIAWTSEEIILSPAAIAPNLAALFSLPDEVIPNLDSDGDGFTNLAEFLDKSDPNDPNSTPQGPELISSLDPQKIYQDEITFSVHFKDASGIANLKPLNPLCGYSSFEFHPVVEGDNSEVELKATFNLHASTATDSINLILKATDIWGASSDHTLTFKFTKNPNSPIHGPELTILKPSEGESISGETPAEAVACHEAPILSLQPTLGDIGDEDPKPESYQGKINSAALGDGPKTLTFKAIGQNPLDPNQTYSQERSVNIQVDNSNPIRIDSPAPGATIRDVTTFIFSVDESKLAGVTELYVESVTANGEEEPVFASLKNGDDNSEAAVYKKSVDTTSILDEREITINLKAISPTKTVARKVTYRVLNSPKIEEFKLKNSDSAFLPCLSGGQTLLEWSVSNRGNNDGIYLNDAPLKNGNDWIAVGSQSVTCNPNTYTLKATRNGQDMQGNSKQFTATQTVNLVPISINGISEGLNLPPTDLESFFFKLNGMPASQPWKIDLKKNGQAQAPLEGTGPTVNLGNLVVGANYEIAVSLLNKKGQVLSQSSLITFHAAPGLVGWWRFDDANLGLDSSGLGNDGVAQMVTKLDSGCVMGSCAKLSNNSSIEVPSNASLNPDEVTTEFWINWDGDVFIGAYLYKPNFQYGIGITGQQLLNFRIVNEQNESYGVGISSHSVFSTSGQWYHVTFVYDATKQLVQLFINGSLKNETFASGKIIKNNNPLYLALLSSGSKIDEAKLYNRPLTQAEIKASCNSVMPGHCP